MGLNSIISEKKLIQELEHFRDILLNYDFSEVDNLIFFDIQSLDIYLQTYEDNPFERQYKDLETSLNILIPYLPIRISNDTIEMITKFLNYKNQDEEIIKKNIVFNLKMDFIDRVKNIKTEDEWKSLILQCSEIRKEKKSKEVSTCSQKKNHITH